MKYIVLIILAVIVVSLATALLDLFRGRDSDRMLKALIWRIGLSVFLILVLFVGAIMGLIQPHSPGF